MWSSKRQKLNKASAHVRICRQCRHRVAVGHTSDPCPCCGARRWLSHPDLANLTLAHIDCDAFYAAVEKRERPELRDKPVIVGGRQRGVVTTACYIARLYGVKSAMATVTARAKCPQGVFLKPRMALYRQVGLQIRDAMRRLSAEIQPVSIDEAYLDLSRAHAIHGKPAYAVLLDFQDWVEREMGLTISIGLAHNKLLAKIASDLEKPRGFSVLGPSDGAAFLADKPVRILWGVGPAMAKSLARRGVRTVGDLKRFDEATLTKHYGTMGPRLAAFARAEDTRRVRQERGSKSISAETTFGHDLGALADLQPILSRLAGRVAARTQRSGLQGWTVTVKLKTEDFQTFTRRQKLDHPSDAETTLEATGLALVRKELSRGPFRLLGLGISDFVSANQPDAQPQPQLLDDTLYEPVSIGNKRISLSRF